MDDIYVVHYAEIGLKGQNRSVFEKQLIENICRQHEVTKSWRLPGRILLRAESDLDLSAVFGVAWWARAERVGANVDEIADKAIEEIRRGMPGEKSFAVRAKVADKSFALNSQELEREIGQRIRIATEQTVDLTEPERTVFVEVTHAGALIFSQKKAGPGGLPVGTSPRLLGLFSGGMDSALASYLMAKRGSRIELVHFHAMASADAVQRGKIGEMVRILGRYDPQLVVHYVPYHRFQLATSSLPKKLQRHELVVFRRFMARVAERLAKMRRAGALFSGDNLGQVASQTLENLIAVDRAISIPLFRPVIAYDKIEIVNMARKIGLYDISIMTYKDCCSLIAKHPATRANQRMIDVLEAEIGMDELLEDVMSEVISIEGEAA